MTAATIPKIRATDEPVLMEASLLGAEVASAEEVALWLVELRVLVTEPKVASLEEEVKVAVLNVEFRLKAVPVPKALPTLVMLAVLLLGAVVVVALEDELPSMVKRPE